MSCSNQSEDSWRLPFDVLLNVMACCTQSHTVASLMTTCYALYSVGQKYLLRRVRLRTLRQTHSFMDFLFAKSLDCIHYIRDMDISLCRLDPKASIGLSALLCSTHLSLDNLVVRHLDVLLMDQRMRAALVDTERVRRLFVCGGAQLNSYAFIHRYPSKHSNGTITSKRGVHIVCDVSQPAFVQISAFAYSIPELGYFRLVPTDRIYAAGLPSPPVLDRIRHARNQNRHVQFQHNGLRRLALAECFGELMSIYALGLTCTLSKLRIWKLLCSADLIPVFRDVVADTRPTHLSLSVAGLDVIRWVLSVLWESEPQRLRTLDLNVTLRLSESHGRSSNDILESIALALVPLPRFTKLHLVLNAQSWHYGGPGWHKWSPADGDLEALRLRIFDSAESLKDVAVSVADAYYPDWP